MEGIAVALDQGTTSSRAVVYTMEGEIRAIVQREFKQYFPKPGWVEHDPEEIFSTQLEVAREAIEKAGGPDNLLFVSITNQRETTVVWDKKTGKPLYNAIVWQCRRSSEICEALKKDGLEDEIKRKTGLVIDPYFSATKLVWLFDNVDSIKSLAQKGDMAFGTVDSWLIYRLTGKHLTDYSNASRTMLFNINNLEWDRGLLDIFKLPFSILPEPRPSMAEFGKVDKSFFGKEVPVVGVLGDQQSSLLGQGCLSQGMVKNTYGTGCFVLMNTGHTPRFSEKGLLTTCCWSDNEGVIYALEGSVFIAGAVVQWLRDKLGIIDSSEQSESIATSVESNEGVYFVPAFVGLGAPYWDMNCRGTIVGLTRGTGAAHIVRAALESIAYQTADVLALMEEESGLEVREIRVDGGASANRFLMQFQSDIIERVVERPEVLESTSRGAFFAGMVGTGRLKLEDTRKMVRISERFVPKMNESERSRLLDGWRAALKKAMA